MTSICFICLVFFLFNQVKFWEHRNILSSFSFTEKYNKNVRANWSKFLRSKTNVFIPWVRKIVVIIHELCVRMGLG